jgi:hypothetical protein
VAAASARSKLAASIPSRGSSCERSRSSLLLTYSILDAAWRCRSGSGSCAVAGSLGLEMARRSPPHFRQSASGRERWPARDAFAAAELIRARGCVTAKCYQARPALLAVQSCCVGRAALRTRSGARFAERRQISPRSDEAAIPSDTRIRIAFVFALSSDSHRTDFERRVFERRSDGTAEDTATSFSHT